MKPYVITGAAVGAAFLFAPLMDGNQWVNAHDFLLLGWFVAGLVIGNVAHMVDRKPWRWHAATWTGYGDELRVGVRRWHQKVVVRTVDSRRDGFDDSLYEALAEAKQQAVALNVAQKP